MSTGLPAPKPLSVSRNHSLGPAAARAATQEAQIVQLVQQNRALEHAQNQLHTELRDEKARGLDVINQIRERWKAERKEWRDGCDSLQEKHRLAHLETRVALENERGLRLEDREALIREKTATLLREYKITLFQMRETDLAAQVAGLEEELHSQREEVAESLAQYQAELARMTMKLAKADARRQEDIEQAHGFAQEKKAIEAELSTLRASVAADTKHIDRLKLQIETLRTQNVTFETRNRELQHQVDKWQSLEGKGEKEVEALRKRRIELEVRVKELEVHLKESRNVDKKIAKLEESLLETQEQVEQDQKDLAEAQAEAEQAQIQVAKLQRQNKKLQAALEAEKTRSAAAKKEERDKVQLVSKPSNGARTRAPSVIRGAPENSDNEIEDISSESPRSQKPESTHSSKPKARGKSKRKEKGDDDSEPTSEHFKDRQKGRQRGKESNDETTGTEDGELKEREDGEVKFDNVEEAAPLTKKRGRPREQESEVEEIPIGKRLRLAKSKQLEEPRDAVKRPRSKAKETNGEDQQERPQRKPKNKPASTNGSPRSEDLDAEEPTKKKKRKLNSGPGIFGGPVGFTWNQDVEGNLGIPSVLSPVKDGQPVPARSNSSLLGMFKPWG